MRVVVGYQTWPGVSCPFCQGAHGMLEDDGDPETLLYRCWCGGTAKVRRDDPELAPYLRPPAEPEDEPDPFMVL